MGLQNAAELGLVYGKGIIVPPWKGLMAQGGLTCTLKNSHLFLKVSINVSPNLSCRILYLH